MVLDKPVEVEQQVELGNNWSLYAASQEVSIENRLGQTDRAGEALVTCQTVFWRLHRDEYRYFSSCGHGGCAYSV